jgi:hypothetical protein
MPSVREEISRTWCLFKCNSLGEQVECFSRLYTCTSTQVQVLKPASSGSNPVIRKPPLTGGLDIPDEHGLLDHRIF